ncbi:MAG: replisome organizer [Erysipelotrichaceae bacterium]|nr:replisome organizer [Erysipelotrichaceae bacterium]
MANRRMISLSVVDSDVFLNMPHSTQSLYFHLCVRADDDGFIDSPQKILRIVGCKDKDLNILIDNKFVIPFKSGVIVIVHWKLSNRISDKRRIPTLYNDELQTLIEKNGVYSIKNDLNTECIQNVSKANTECIQNVSKMSDSIVKDSIVKDSIVKNINNTPTNQEETKKKIIKHKYGEFKHVLLSDDEMKRLKNDFPFYEDLIKILDEYCETSGKTYKNYSLVLRKWVLDEYNKSHKVNHYNDNREDAYNEPVETDTSTDDSIKF